MSPQRAQDRLNALAIVIRRLCIEVVEHERAAGELAAGDLDADGEDAAELSTARVAAKAFETRLRRDQALIAYFDESERLRLEQCSIHGGALYTSCGECVAIINARRALRVA